MKPGAALVADDGAITERERRELVDIYAEALDQLRQVGALLSEGVTP